MRHWQASNAKVVFLYPTLKLQHSDTHEPKKQNTTKCRKRKTSPEIQFPHIIFPEMWKLLSSLEDKRRKEQFEGGKIYCVNEQRQCVTSIMLRLLCLWLYRSSRSGKTIWGRGYGQGSSDQCPVISWSGKYQYNPDISPPSQFWPFIWSYHMLKSVFSLS